jgi:hypothetical protein
MYRMYKVMFTYLLESAHTTSNNDERVGITPVSFLEEGGGEQGTC